MKPQFNVRPVQFGHMTHHVVTVSGAKIKDANGVETDTFTQANITEAAAIELAQRMKDEEIRTAFTEETADWMISAKKKAAKKADAPEKPTDEPTA